LKTVSRPLGGKKKKKKKKKKKWQGGESHAALCEVKGIIGGKGDCLAVRKTEEDSYIWGSVPSPESPVHIKEYVGGGRGRRQQEKGGGEKIVGRRPSKQGGLKVR